MSYDQHEAIHYEDQSEHALPVDEADAWLAEMATVTKDGQPGGDLLDIGAGTGLLTGVMKQAGFRVTGLEPSASMIEQGVKRNPLLRPGDFVLGQAGDAGLFEAARFDWVVSRQVLCHLTEPESCFLAWRRWMRTGAHLLLVDGFWPRASWSESDLEAQPFASLDSLEPVTDALEAAGFSIVRAGAFAALNEARARRWPGSTPRYRVLARKR